MFFHGLHEGEIIEAELAEGRSLMIKLRSIEKPDLEGYRTLVFDVNRNRREIKIKDKNWSNINLLSQTGEYSLTEMADPDNKHEIGSPIPGTVVTLLVKEGDKVTENQPLMVVEAMKMETRITSSFAGIVSSVNIKEGQQVKVGELLIVVK